MWTNDSLNNITALPLSEWKLSQTSQSSQTYQVIFLFGAFFVSIVGDLAIFVKVFKDKNGNNTIDAFIINLAVMDLLASLFTWTPCLATHISGEWHFGQIGCQVQGVFGGMRLACDLLTLTSFSIDCHIRVMWPLHYYTRYFRKKISRWMIFGIWCASLFAASIPFIAGGCYVFNTYAGVCLLPNTMITHIVSFLFIITNFIITTVCFIMLGHKLRTRKRRIVALFAGMHQRLRFAYSRRKEDIRLSATLLILASVYIVCWIPFSVFKSMLLGGMDLSSQSRLIFYLFCTYSAFTPILNPLVLMKYRHTFRHFSRTIFQCGCRCADA